MRCRECNVDLPKEYTSCPLCGGKVSEDEPLIEGIAFAEYPKVKTEKYKRDPFLVFLAVWAVFSASAVVLFKAGKVDSNVFALLVSLVPLVWTLIFRPLTVRQPYEGNYVIMNLFPLALGGFLYCLIKQAMSYFFVTVLPLAFVLVLAALLVVVVIRPKNAKRASSYAVLSGISGVAAEIAVVIAGYDFLNAWLIEIFICAVILVILFCRWPKETKEELKAKFSIQ